MINFTIKYNFKEVRIINYNALIIILVIISVILYLIVRSKNIDIQLLKDKLNKAELASAKHLQEFRQAAEELSSYEKRLANVNKDISEQANARFCSIMSDFVSHSPFSKSTAFRSIASDYIVNEERFMNAFGDTKMSFLSVPEITAKVKGQSGEVYDVSLESCTCADFQFRHKPCKHMYRLAIHIGALGYVNTGKVEQCLNDYISKCKEYDDELLAFSRGLELQRCKIEKQKAEVVKNEQALKQERSDILSLNRKCYSKFMGKLNNSGYNPAWIAKMYADYYDMFTGKLTEQLISKVRPAKSLASTIEKNYRKEMRELAKIAKYNESLVLLYESFYPNLPILCELSAEDIPQELDELSELEPKSEYESMRKWLSRADYDLLSPTERNQLALDNYKHRRRSNWEAGRDYERYVCYLYEKNGYRVVCFGALNGLSDLGRDLYAFKGNEVIIIQCKRWSAQKTIHEKHIYQLFGTVTDYSIDNPQANARGLLLSTCALSNKAQEVAQRIGIDYEENTQFPDYPLIKCNISRASGEKIYHLPFDQQYDKVQIDYSTGERYAWTVKEAERLGFRRAHRHMIAAEQ